MSIAQNGLTSITGTITEKANIELMLGKSVNGKSERVGQYITDPNNRQFAFSFPQDDQAIYKLAIRIMKQGHRRLELDKSFTVPISLKGGQHSEINITPSLLDTTSNKGIEIKTPGTTSAITQVNGTISNWSLGGEIGIAKVVEGALVPITTFNVSKTNANFSLSIPVQKEGFYYLTTPRWHTRVYLKPSDQLQLQVDGKNGSLTLVQGSEENMIVAEWNKLSLPITGYGYNNNFSTNDTINCENYLLTYKQLQPDVVTFQQKIHTSNQKFNELFKLAVRLDNQFAPLNLIHSVNSTNAKRARAGKPTSEKDLPVDAAFLNSNILNSASILQFGEAGSFINQYCTEKVKASADEKKLNMTSAERLRMMIETIPNDTLKSYLLKNQLAEMETEVHNLSEFKSTFVPLKKYAITPSTKQKYQQVFEQFAGDTAWLGKSSYNFSLPDTSGRIISTKDFKGKVVLIDVWATWCGPCKGEMPYMKAIEEEYKGKNIVFVGISLDQAKDKQKWKNYVEGEKLPGVQLMDDFGKTFGRKYQIAGIPRFMLIDTRGNWIEVRCPNPSDTEALKKYIDAALNNEG
jgi:thiol-disulfide isomerase/thioredoxin